MQDTRFLLSGNSALPNVLAALDAFHLKFSSISKAPLLNFLTVRHFYWQRPKRPKVHFDAIELNYYMLAYGCDLALLSQKSFYDCVQQLRVGAVKKVVAIWHNE